MHAYMLKSLQSCPTLCDPINCSPPGSSVRGIFQARILEWLAMPSSRGSSPPRDQTHVSCTSCSVGKFCITEPPGKPNRYILLYIKQITNMVILCSIGDYTQYLVITYNRKESEKEYIYLYIHIYLNHFAVYLKLTQPCKSNIL